VEGEFQLFVEMAEWTLELRDAPIVTSESSAAEIDRSLARLEGQKLTRASISATPAVSVFAFDLGATLSVSSHQEGDPDSELWHLFHPPLEICLLASGMLVLANYATNQEERIGFYRIEFVG